MVKDYRILESESIYDIEEFLNKSKKREEIHSFIDPYLLDIDFSEQVIRNTCFNFSRVYIASMNKEKIENICFFEAAQYPYTTKNVTIKFMSNISKYGVELLKYSIENIKSLFSEYNKVIINIEEKELDKMTYILSELNFTREMYLQDEFGKEKNLIIFSRSI